MTTKDLAALAQLTRDYAACQTRTNGLGTFLGGTLAFGLPLFGLGSDRLGISLVRPPLAEAVLLVPFLWLGLKGPLARLAYGRLGTVKAAPDPAYERRLAAWRLALALLLVACLATALWVRSTGAFQTLAAGTSLTHPWGWLTWVPLLYLAPVPWAWRGVEEARAYTVLVVQSLLWLLSMFLATHRSAHPGALLPEALRVLGHLAVLSLWFLSLLWAALAIVRGWKEHLAYLRLLRALPRTS